MLEDSMIEWQNVCSSRNGHGKKREKMKDPAPRQMLLLANLRRLENEWEDIDEKSRREEQT